MVDITIDVVDRGSFRADLNYMVEGAVMATKDEHDPSQEFVEFPVYNLAIDHPDGTILWDTGIHHEAAEGHWPEGMYAAFPAEDASDHPLDEDLARAGWEIDDIDYVVMSHLHVDHTGGLHFFDGTDTPIIVHEDDLTFAYYSAVSGKGGVGYLLEDIHLDLNWRVIHNHHTQLFEDIEFIHSPGHSPGLLSTMIHLDNGQTVIFTGDEAYMARNYENEEPLGAGLLWDRQDWMTSLYHLKDLERRHEAEMVFGHPPGQIDDIRDGW